MTQSQMTTSGPSGGNSANLDLLRSMAVLMVLIDHLCRRFQLERISRMAVVDIGAFGVLLFFVHTSLVLMHSMRRSNLTGLALMRNFHIRRIFRIYPLSILAVISAVAFHLHANGRGLVVGTCPAPLEFFSNLFLVQNLTYSDSIIGPLWSLPIELQMYLVLPFLFLWRKLSLRSLLALWIVFGAVGHLPQVVPGLGWFTLLLYVPNFLPGVMAFVLPEKRVLPAHLWLPFVAALGLVYALLPGRRIGGELCLLLGLAIPLFKEITFFLASRIASYSYGIYLAHSFCIWLAFVRLHSWPLFIGLMVVSPVVLYHLVELPAIRLGSRLALRMSRPRLEALAATS
ncbi:MAG: hypothetical protein DMG68_11915 [Acidobacteria bacterium]|nr:MAG: hypothetical protein DMG68_11915 [Acidobacteriota bacterium]